MNTLNICVIGGGPGGSFFAIHILRLAKKIKKKINITIFDRKDFCDYGPKGCNMCAGILQSSLVERLKNIGIILPEEIIVEKILGYAFHLKGVSAFIKKEYKFPIFSVFRGGGPLDENGELKLKKSFDQFLLNQAIKEGANFINERVNKIEIKNKTNFQIFYGTKVKSIHNTDFLIGAFGVNTAIIKEIPFNYKPPKTWTTCQAEIHLDEDYISKKFENMIHVFFTKRFGIKFIAITPKKSYITLTAIGKHVKINDLYREIAVSEIKDFLPKDWEISCYCSPQMPVSSPIQPYSNNCIILGDASYSRYLKNGIESAFISSQFAAETIIKQGTSKTIIGNHYNKLCKNLFHMDNQAGKLLFFIHDIISSNKTQSKIYLDMVKKEQNTFPKRKQKLSEILWHLYTGDISYINIFRKALDFKLQAKLTYETIKKIF